MRQDQLEKARAARWRQDGNALVTLDDAERWLAETPLCLYLPRRLHLPVPAPSFVEAVAGAPDATPGPERLAAAAEMLSRLVASGAVVALSLFGAASGMGGEQPDFLATPEALPFLYALQPERNPKRPPSTVGSGRVSPLAAEAYKTLERDGAQTSIELRERLGREVTEAAVLRALSELWHTMRAVPVPAVPGDTQRAAGAHWELLAARHRRELTMGSTQAQTTALAMLISFYLRSAVAATGEDVELFLSPVSSRARIRDVVHGLTATRQLGEFSLSGNAQLYVEGTLPEIADEEVAVAEMDAGLEENQPSFLEAAASGEEAAASGGAEEPDALRPPAQRSSRPAVGRPATGRPAFGDRARTGFAAGGRSTTGSRPPREGGFRKPEEGEFRRRSETSRGADRPRTTGARADRPGTGAPRTDRPRSERPPRTNRLTSSGQPRRPGGFGAARPASAHPAGGGFRRDAAGGSARPTAGARGAGSRPPFRSAGSSAPGSDRPFPAREGTGAPGRPPRSARPSFARPDSARTSSPRTGFAGRGGDSRPPRRDGESFKKPYAPRGARPAGDRPAGARPAGDRPFKKPYAARGERPAGGGAFKKPYAPRGDRPDRPSGDRPFKKPYAARGERPAGDRPFKKPYAPRTGASAERRPAASGSAAPRRSFAPRPAAAGAEGSAAPRRPYTPRPAGAAGRARPAFSKGPGFSKSPGSSKGPGFSKGPGLSKGPGDRSPARSTGAARPGGFSKPGGKPAFSKTGGPGKRFGAPRPGSSRPVGSRPGGSRPGAPRLGGPRAGAAPRGDRPTRSAGPPRGAARPGGFSPPKRKPKSEGDEG